VFCNVGTVLCGSEEPFARGLCIRDGLLGGKRLARDDEERRFGIDLAECLSKMCSIDVGYEVRGKVALGIGFQRLRHHYGTEIGTSDADIDDGGDGLASVPLPRATAHRIGELLDVLQDLRDFVDPRLGNFISPETSKGDVKDRTILRGVDMLSGEHLVTVPLDARLAGQFEKSVQDRLRDQVLGIVEEESVGGIGCSDILLGEFRKSRGIGGKEIFEDEGLVLAIVQLLEFLPRGIL